MLQDTDDTAIPHTARIAPESSDDALSRSFERHPVRSLNSSRLKTRSTRSPSAKLPGRVPFDVLVLADLRLSARLAFDAAFDIGSVRKRRGEFFLSSTQCGHHHARTFLRRERSDSAQTHLLMLAAVVKVEGDSKHHGGQRRIHRNASPIPSRSLDPSLLVAVLFALGHEVLYHE